LISLINNIISIANNNQHTPVTTQPKSKRGRKRLPRDENGNIIRN
jgi:hypothetical protein